VQNLKLTLILLIECESINDYNDSESMNKIMSKLLQIKSKG